jgi:hypothetical protein
VVERLSTLLLVNLGIDLNKRPRLLEVAKETVEHSTSLVDAYKFWHSALAKQDTDELPDATVALLVREQLIRKQHGTPTGDTQPDGTL